MGGIRPEFGALFNPNKSIRAGENFVRSGFGSASDLSIDENALRQVIDYQIEMGVDGICVQGSTGGNGSFADDEMKRITEVASRHAGGRIRVIAGTGARMTAACIQLSKHAQEVGCDGVMILPVSYWPLTENEVREHYERVAAAIRIPICVYNNPWTTGVSPLARHERFIDRTET